METFNKDNLKDLKKQILKTYVLSETTNELHEQINSLLGQEDYEQIQKIFEEYAQNIINNKNLKNFRVNGSNPFGAGMTYRPVSEDKTSSEGIDPQAFELYCILMLTLINEYEIEQNQYKKKLLESEIQSAIERYRNPEEVETVKSR